MKIAHWILLLCVVGAAAAVPASVAASITVSRFAEEGLAGWQTQSFQGTTDYRIVEDAGRTVLQAHAQNAASGLTRELTFDPQVHRYLTWRWKVAGTISGGDEKSKQGDDYAARIYVVFPGRFFWQTRALNYIWANQLPRGEFIPNAFTANAVMIAVQSGPAGVGEWHQEERDILADYRRAFGDDPPKAGAIAIMTDTDNTGGAAMAWYDRIILTTSQD